METKVNPLLPINILWTASVPLLILAVSAFRRDPQRRRLDFTTVIGYCAYLAVGGLLMMLMLSVFPARWDCDPALRRIDAALGFDTLSFADVISHWRVVMLLSWVSYMALAPLIGTAWLLEQDQRMRRALLIGGCASLVFYAIFPAVGPGNFDWSRNVAHYGAPFNCMPSMHVGWPLLMAFNARSKLLRSGLWGYVALTLLSTLALREHYLIDLIAAFPFTLGVQWISSRMLGQSRGWVSQGCASVASGSRFPAARSSEP